MDKTGQTGARIRARRIHRGLTQAGLARDAGISAPYLNLIEHGRRPVGSRVLSQIARALHIDPARLSEGEGRDVLAGLWRASDRAEAGTPPERDRAERFIADYPGWAALLSGMETRIEELERRVVRMGERMAHDPVLSASVHDMLSSVTAIRSTAAILVEDALEPEWQSRFHRNVHEDSRRLADRAQELAAYLNAGDSTARGAMSPQEEVEAWLADRNWTIAEIEEGGRPSIAKLEPHLRAALEIYVERYAVEARALPHSALVGALKSCGPDPVALADRLRQPLALVMRRLAQLPEKVLGGPVGLVECDASGTLVFRRPVAGFDIPRFGAACALWPLYQALLSPHVPVRSTVRQSGPDMRPVDIVAAVELAPATGVAGPLVARATMLIIPPGTADAAPADVAPTIGSTCRLCGVPSCRARREANVL